MSKDKFRGYRGQDWKVRPARADLGKREKLLVEDIAAVAPYMRSEVPGIRISGRTVTVNIIFDLANLRERALDEIQGSPKKETSRPQYKQYRSHHKQPQRKK